MGLEAPNKTLGLSLQQHRTLSHSGRLLSALDSTGRRNNLVESFKEGLVF